MENDEHSHEHFGNIINPLMREENMCGTYLRLDKSEVSVGEDVLLTWNLPEFVTDYQDWIGMYEKDEDCVEQHLQAKQRCQNYSQYGSIQWKIDAALFTKRYTDVIFYYFNLNQNEIIGSSTMLTVINPSAPLMDGTPLVDVDPNQLLSVTITGLSAANLLCKVVGSNPDPYVKLMVVPGNQLPKLPHHNQLKVLLSCNGTVHPHWYNLDMGLVVLPTDTLEIDIRDKFSVRYFRISHFLGRAKVPINQFVRSGKTRTLTFSLGSRLAMDHVQGSVTITIANNGPCSSPIGEFIPPQNLPEQVSLEDSVMVNSEDVATTHAVDKAVVTSSSSQNMATPLSPRSDGTVLSTANNEKTVTTALSLIDRETTASLPAGSGKPILSQSTRNDTEPPSMPSQYQKMWSWDDATPVSKSSTAAPSRRAVTCEFIPPKNLPEQVSLEDSVMVNSEDVATTHAVDKAIVTSSSSSQNMAAPLSPRSDGMVLSTANNEKTVTTALSLIDRETTASLPAGSEKPILSQSTRNDTEPPSMPSQYQKMWSWDDATPVNKSSTAAPSRRAVTCMHRPPASQPQHPHRSIDVTVLRRGRGSSFHSRSLRHQNPLPPSWSMRMDSVGRNVYINHVDRSVTLHPPSVQDSITSNDRQSSINKELGRYNERINYQQSGTLQLCDESSEGKSLDVDQLTASSIRTPITLSSFDQKHDQRPDQGATDQVMVSTSVESTRRVEREQSVTTETAQSPGLLFITWSDVYAYMRSEGVKAIGDDFFSDHFVVKLFQHIRANHSVFKKYQHHPRLVAALNKFALTDCDLPDKWEKRLDKNSKAIFINHDNRSTSFIDPRLPYPGNNLKVSTTIKNWKSAARDNLKGIESITSSTSHISDSSFTTVDPRLLRDAATLDRQQLFTHTNIDDVGGGDEEMRRPRSHSMSSSNRNVRTIERNRYLARRNRPSHARDTRPQLVVQNVAESEEEVYQRRVVEFLRQDDIISIIADRYDGYFSEELRSTISAIAEEGPSKLRSLNNDSEITFQLGLILSLFEDAIVHHARLVTSRNTRPQPSSQPPATPLPRPPTPVPDSSSSPPEPLSPALLESTAMTPYGFTEGALNRFFTQDGITKILRDAGYVSDYVTSIVEAILSSGIASVIASGDYNTNRILKYVIDAIQQKIEQYIGESRGTISSLPGESRSSVCILPVLDDTLTDAEILAFIMQPNLYTVLSRRYQPVPSRMRVVISEIKYEGVDGIKRKRNSDADLQKLIRDFTDEIKSYWASVPTQQRKSIFAIKLELFRSKLTSAGYRTQIPETFTVSRDTLLHDAYESMMSCNIRAIRKMNISVEFKGEEGLDYGGPSREFYFFVSRELFNPYYGLFEYSSAGSYTVQISPHSMDILDALQWFRFAGRFTGIAVVQGYLVDVFFARHVYKALLGQPYSVEDLQVVDLEFFNSLKYVLDNDPESLALTFSIEEQSFGVITEHELIKNGKNIAVVEENKIQYVDLMVQYRLSKGTTKQTEAFVKGFKEVIPPSILTFDPQELEWLIAGQAQIDIADWKENTVYWGYEENSDVIIWFWRLVKEYSNEQRLRLLQFVTGTSSIPLEGFKGLKGSDGTNQRFIIDVYYNDNPDNLFPMAHTCFNRLDIPVYSSYNVLKNKLTRAIEETEAFGHS